MNLKTAEIFVRCKLTVKLYFVYVIDFINAYVMCTNSDPSIDEDCEFKFDDIDFVIEDK